ncbi:hypothetical protein [Paenibacillus oleatilyticus]|uniref:DUF1641 domain-containing protein n=1 Tax=Paenibacillus oleatilyticus TaxID=2594886 RepID=A0ABV4UVE5_9BACL
MDTDNPLERLKKIDFKIDTQALVNHRMNQLKVDSVSEISIKKFRNPTHELIDVVRENHSLDEKYHIEMINILQKIEENTASIRAIVELLQNNSDRQEQILELLKEVISLGTVKSKEEADSVFQKTLTKIQGLGGTVESVQTLIGFLNTVYNSTITLL